MSNPGPNIVSPEIQRGQAVVSVAVAPSSVGAATSAEQTVTVPGVAIGDFVAVMAASGTGNATAIAGARVSAANTVAIRYINPTAGALTPGASIYQVYIARSYPVMMDFGITAFNNIGPVAGTNP